MPGTDNKPQRFVAACLTLLKFWYFRENVFHLPIFFYHKLPCSPFKGCLRIEQGKSIKRSKSHKLFKGKKHMKRKYCSKLVTHWYVWCETDRTTHTTNKNCSFFLHTSRLILKYVCLVSNFFIFTFWFSKFTHQTAIKANFFACTRRSRHRKNL